MSLELINESLQPRFHTIPRSFAYDSLGRLTRQKLAEQTATINDSGNYVPEVSGVRTGAVWSEAFEYDARSNLKKRTDARGVITTLSYDISSALDPLNRLPGITYSTSGADTTYTINPAASVSLEYKSDLKALIEDELTK
jgi:YD repeat-containing protein